MLSVCDRTSCPADHNLQSTGRGVVNLVTVRIAGYPFHSWFAGPLGIADLVLGRDISATMGQAP
jgi:hypothetical protein